MTVGLARKHGLKEDAATLDKNQLSIQAILFIEADIPREPKRNKLAAGGRIGDNDTFESAGRMQRLAPV